MTTQEAAESEVCNEMDRLRQENADLREAIAISSDLVEAGTCLALRDEIDDLRSRCSAAIKTLVDTSRIDVGSCPYCEEMWSTTGCDRVSVRKLALQHDRRCPQNPLRAEMDALRDAVIEVADRQVRRDNELIQIRAIRAAANDISTPFSEESIKARLEKMRTSAAVVKVDE